MNGPDTTTRIAVFVQRTLELNAKAAARGDARFERDDKEGVGICRTFELDSTSAISFSRQLYFRTRAFAQVAPIFQLMSPLLRSRLTSFPSLLSVQGNCKLVAPELDSKFGEEVNASISFDSILDL